MLSKYTRIPNRCAVSTIFINWSLVPYLVAVVPRWFLSPRSNGSNRSYPTENTLLPLAGGGSQRLCVPGLGEFGHFLNQIVPAHLEQLQHRLAARAGHAHE